MNDDEYAELFKKLPSSSSSGTSWEDVASEFGNLGKTLGDMFRNAFQTEADVGELRFSLQGLLDDMNRAVDGSPETAQARDQLVRLTDTLRQAYDRAGEEIRPELLNMLRQANTELRKRSNLEHPEG